MALTDDRSPRLNLPLPASTNKLKDDVLRIRDAMNSLDATAVKQVKSFAALRTIIPTSAGDRIFIQSHTDNSADPSLPPCGEGWFVGYTTKQADDGGYVASNGSNWHWRREKNIADLTVLDFGGIPGGVVDCAPAAKKMYEFVNGDFAKSLTNSLSPMVGIRFTAGTFYMTPLDMTKYGTKLWSGSPELPYYPSGYGAAAHFVLRGVDVKFGRSIATRIISDKSDAAVLAVNHRYFTISGIEWDGQQTIQQDAYNKDSNPNGLNLPIGATGLADLPNFLSNHQPFFTNECAGGTFANISQFRAANTGEAAIYYKDSLDSKITQIYGSRTGGNVIKVGWTNRMPGNWNHSTAIEITEFNFQYPYAPALWIPRHGQGLIRNGWIEHGYVPMDINNGQWLIEALSIEDCVRDAVFYNSRVVMSQWSNPTGVKYDRTTAPGSANWYSHPKNPDGSDITSVQSEFEMGMGLFQNFGTYLDHPLRAQWNAGILRGKLDPNVANYLNIGRFRMPQTGTHWVIEIECRGLYGGTGTGPMPLTADRSGGTLRIHVTRGAGNSPTITYWHEGQPGITSVLYGNQTFNDVLPSLWVRLPATYGEYAVHVRGTGETRLDAGSWAIFSPDGTVQASAPTGVTAAAARVSMHTGSAGFGAQEDVAAISSRSQASSAVPVEQSKPRQWLRMNINGKEFAVPYYAYTPVITTQPAAAVSLAVGGTLTLSVAANDAAAYYWQKSTDGGANWTNLSNGAALTTYTKTGIVAGDAGQYRCVVKGELGAIDSATLTNQTNSNVTTVTVS